MKKAIWKGNAIVLAAALCCALVLCAWMLDERMTANMREQMAGLVRAAALQLDETGDLQRQATGLADAAGMRVTIVASNGRVLADSAADAAGMPNHLDREEILQAAGGGVGTAVHASDLLGRRLMYTALRLPGGGYLRFAAEYSGFAQDLALLWPMLLVSALAGAAVAIPMAGRQAGAIARPVADLCVQLMKGRDGDMELDCGKYEYPELRQIAGDINRLSAGVRASRNRLQAERQKIDYILDNMGEGVILLDENKRVLTINRAACRFFECSRRRSKDHGMVFVTRNQQVLKELDRVMDDGEETAQVELPLADKRTALVTISRVQQGQGGLSGGATLIIGDITERKNAAAMRQEFFQAASHELKTPITSIRGFAELLCSDMPLGEEQRREFSKRILKEANRMASLIADIIMISRLESGDIAFEREDLDLEDVLNESVDAVRMPAAQAGVELRVETESCPLHAARREMEQLMSNLLTNAVRYNRPGGRVEATLEMRDGRPVFGVFNTGEPIAEEYRDRIFERFFRIDKGRSKAGGGTGLGLAIVKHIAAEYGAAVELETCADGNRFTVRF